MSALARAHDAPVSAPSDAEYAFTDADFRRIAAMLREDSGIHLSDSKAALVYARLSKRLRRLGLRAFQDYCRLVASPEGREERGHMLSALTTNLTKFFREPHHFEHLRRNLLEPMAAEIRAGARLRIWSSACSTGEEPYSIALTVLDCLPEASQLDVKVLATDIDPVVVEKARKGVYTRDDLSPVPPALRDRWMAPVSPGETWTAGAEMRDLIGFRTLNLLHEWPMKQKYQAVFCRNVVIYFEEDVQNALWAKFRKVIAPKGRLYVGHSERVMDTGYASDGLTVYRLKESA